MKAPQLGEIRRGREIGKAKYNKYIWSEMITV